MNLTPTETIKLASQGLVYPADSPLSKGELEMKYVTTKEEDILTNVNFMKEGTVFEKLLKSLIQTPGINPEDLILGDRSSLLIAARILAYGKEYTFNYYNKVLRKNIDTTIDLTQIKEKEIDLSLFKAGKNEFDFQLPNTNNVVTFKLLTNKDEKDINSEIKGLQKIDPSSNSEISTRLKHTIIAVNGKRDTEFIRKFVDSMLAIDSRALRKYINKISPDIDLVYYPDNYDGEEGVNIPIGINFLWPDFGL